MYLVLWINKRTPGLVQLFALWGYLVFDWERASEAKEYEILGERLFIQNTEYLLFVRNIRASDVVFSCSKLTQPLARLTQGLNGALL